MTRAESLLSGEGSNHMAGLSGDVGSEFEGGALFFGGIRQLPTGSTAKGINSYQHHYVSSRYRVMID